MPQTIRTKIETAMQHSLHVLRARKTDEETLHRIAGRFEQLLRTYSEEAVSHCVEMYVETELDWATPGSCGVGRMTDYCPRFGGYFRRPLSRLDAVSVSFLRKALQDCVVSGYVTYVAMQRSVPEPAIASAQELFEEWVPRIYNSPAEYTDTVEGALWTFGEYYLCRLKWLVDERGLAKGSLFSAEKDPNKVALITGHYPRAGFLLRHTEIRAVRAPRESSGYGQAFDLPSGIATTTG